MLVAINAITTPLIDTFTGTPPNGWIRSQRISTSTTEPAAEPYHTLGREENKPPNTV
jgi:hypothetical protein